MSTQNSFTYTGHETFACRSYWLKKGYDFLIEGKIDFNSPESPSALGVGKNMVRSIKFWLKAFDLYDEHKLTPIAEKIFANDGWDPYLEDINTIWLLHYFLVKNSYAKIYSDFFNDFKKRQIEFSFENFERFLKNRESNTADNSLESDVSVLKNNYLRSNRHGNDTDEVFSLFLQELNLIEQISIGNFHFNNRTKSSLSDEIFFFTILDTFEGQTSISFDSLMNDRNCPGNIFCMTQEELFSRISKLEDDYPGVVFTEDAGIRELQITKDNFSTKLNVIAKYYAGTQN